MRTEHRGVSRASGDPVWTLQGCKPPRTRARAGQLRGACDLSLPRVRAQAHYCVVCGQPINHLVFCPCSPSITITSSVTSIHEPRSALRNYYGYLVSPTWTHRIPTCSDVNCWLFYFCGLIASQRDNSRKSSFTQTDYSLTFCSWSTSREAQTDRTAMYRILIVIFTHMYLILIFIMHL